MSMINEKYKYSELTGKIIGCAMEVHKALGNGFQEVIYQRALAYEMELQGLHFSREFEMPVFYKEIQVGTRRVDFLVEEVISVELKALTQIEPVQVAPATSSDDSPSGSDYTTGLDYEGYEMLYLGILRNEILGSCVKGWRLYPK